MSKLTSLLSIFNVYIIDLVLNIGDSAYRKLKEQFTSKSLQFFHHFFDVYLTFKKLTIL